MRMRGAVAAALAGAALAVAAAPAFAAAPIPPALARKNLKADLLRSPKVSASTKQALKGPGGAYGGIDTYGVSYGDLTGDGKADVVVPIYSGGTAGDIAYYVLAVVNGHVTVIRAVNDTYKVGVTINAHKLVVITPDYLSDDPNCCPSFLTTTTFAWNGTKLVQIGKATKKPTAPPTQPTS